jgi:hypothetical protein
MDNTHLAALGDEIRKEFPSFDLVKKSDSKLMTVINAFLKVITFGQMKAFMEDFVTTVGTTVYVPSRWEFWPTPSKMAVLRHERVHMRQSRKYGRLLYSFLYLFFPLPVGLAYFRMKLEREAYEESLRAYAEYYGLQALQDAKIKDSMLRHFTTAEYFWMFPFKGYMSKWYDTRVRLLETEHG